MPYAVLPPFIRWLSRRALRWLYRDVQFVGLEQVPASGATLLIGNHPNDLPDVLLGFFTTRRALRYVATISATSMPLASSTYRGMGVIPVMRVRDVRKVRAMGVDVAAVNREAAATFAAAVGAGDAIGVFPEGGVHDTSHVARFQSGVAKMALNSIDTDKFSDIKIVPLGIQYEAPRTLRSDVIVALGSPFSLRAWLAEQPDGSASALAERMRDALIPVTRNSSSWPNAEARDRLVAAVAAVSANGTDALERACLSVQGRCAKLVEGQDESQTGEHESVVHWRTIADPLANTLRHAGGIETSARDMVRMLDAVGVGTPHARWPSTAWVALAALPAMVGLALHAPLWRGIWALSARLAEVRTDLMARAILPGLHLIFLAYLVFGGVAALGFRAAGLSMWWAAVVVVVLPRLGDLGMVWYDAVRALRLRARVHRWSAADRDAVRASAEHLRAAWMALPHTSP